MRIATQLATQVDDDLLDRRMTDWKRSEAAARDAERLAAASPETGDTRPLAQRASRMRRIADVILASILQDMHITPIAASPVPDAAGSRPAPTAR